MLDKAMLPAKAWGRIHRPLKVKGKIRTINRLAVRPFGILSEGE